MFNETWRSSTAATCNGIDPMMAHSGKRAMVDEALLELGFTPAEKFGAFVTYRRASLKVHVGPNGSFAAFGADDEMLGEGRDSDDVQFVLADTTCSLTTTA